MSGIIHKIEEKLHGGGHEGETKHQTTSSDHKDHQNTGQHKDGMMENIKDKIHGSDSHNKGEKNKEKKKKEGHERGKGHGHDGGSSSSDSD
ncbi:protein SRC1-like [Impatiens glandulifera]|uniref:protein SRC1-like n=1 Tax=Impatiens glandulifera TaxID=253017 RepID=UPI001FB152B3|nr:protein SRC1-like [Impatiens glandulifera]